jgi:hypothetical protein
MYQNFKWKIFQISQPYIGEIEIKGSPLIFIFLSHSKSKKKKKTIDKVKSLYSMTPYLIDI